MLTFMGLSSGKFKYNFAGGCVRCTFHLCKVPHGSSGVNPLRHLIYFNLSYLAPHISHVCCCVVELFLFWVFLVIPFCLHCVAAWCFPPVASRRRVCSTLITFMCAVSDFCIIMPSSYFKLSSPAMPIDGAIRPF